ncbi:hypothetical protein NDU88_006538 [Pleurodeles waltl]|uniref:Uncharacterized protein n=1 Tax=Pleurodeles waltl TaxID=8319 RepID=A0AAV7UM71_PLEWA|nr:hypothetical protein NDU88_006538 [Pleurodeles waltl]
MIIPKDLFSHEWPGIRLLPKDINPGGYQGEKIDIVGYMLSKIEFGKRHVDGKVYVARNGPPILGWHHQYDLHIKIDPRAHEKVMFVDSNGIDEIVDEYKEVFHDTLGELKGYVHKIVVKENSIPVQQKLRRVPILARQEGVDMLFSCIDGIVGTFLMLTIPYQECLGDLMRDGYETGGEEPDASEGISYCVCFHI